MPVFLKRDKALLQSPCSVILVEPRDFEFNPQTSASNYFQTSTREINQSHDEFNALVNHLRACCIHCVVFPSPVNTWVPDAVFPNNWFAVTPAGDLIIFPVMAPNRRDEKNSDIIEWLQKNISLHRVLNLSHYENKGLFLEGTGSLVFDHIYKTAYASISVRTSERLVNEICHWMGYTPFIFYAIDRLNQPVYHTNVVMNMGGGYALVCTEALPDTTERLLLKKHIHNTGREVIELSIDQMHSFCGNMLEVINKNHDPCLVASSTAWNGLNSSQKKLLERYVIPVQVNIPTIEQLGGGSARCMMAGIHVPLQS